MNSRNSFSRMSNLKEIRCTNCGKLVFKADVKEGVVECKCKCGTTVKVEAKPKEQREGRGGFQDRMNLHTKGSG